MMSTEVNLREVAMSESVFKHEIEQKGNHWPYGKQGEGFYSVASKGSFDVLQNAKDVAMEGVSMAIKAYKKRNDGKPFTIVDYGTADGGAALPVITEALEMIVKEIGEDDIVIVYEDQPSNDFNGLFKRLNGVIPTPKSSDDTTPLEPYVKKFHNTFPMASGNSFYERVTPSNWVDLGLCTNALHWLIETPCKIPDALHIAASQDQETVTMFKEKAYQDLKLFLTHRVGELKPGGQFMCIAAAEDDKGQYIGNTKRIPSNLHCKLAELWCTMADEGVITSDEIVNTNFAQYYRKHEEIASVFDEPELSELSLSSLSIRQVNCPLHSCFTNGKMDGVEYAEKMVAAVRTWANSTFLSGLSDERSEQEKMQIVDDLFRRFQSRIQQAPEAHGMDFIEAYFAFGKSL